MIYEIKNKSDGPLRFSLGREVIRILPNETIDFEVDEIEQEIIDVNNIEHSEKNYYKKKKKVKPKQQVKHAFLRLIQTNEDYKVKIKVTKKEKPK